MTAKELAKAAAKTAVKAAAPELTASLKLAQEALKRSRAPAPPTETVVIQPTENPGIYSWGKDRIRVRTKGGVRIVTVERAHRITAGEFVLVAALGGAVLVGYEVKKALSGGGGNPFSGLTSGLSSFYATGGGLPGSATISSGMINNYPNPPA